MLSSHLLKHVTIIILFAIPKWIFIVRCVRFMRARLTVVVIINIWWYSNLVTRTIPFGFGTVSFCPAIYVQVWWWGLLPWIIEHHQCKSLQVKEIHYKYCKYHQPFLAGNLWHAHMFKNSWDQKWRKWWNYNHYLKDEVNHKVDY